ncbi:DUF2652 domain-containing protein [Flavobacterium columnare]|uniref:DUF2652 domain-containing protein n=1 Tax=Flavobacterium TaxID=237 RepID=UPI0018966FA4|nr:DUF2652 domain-containing protein [Flavobacterium columnare]MBF6652955.1 DUF2652 domain-containing protein [Flavobacterium columnare]MBF6657539.1 DUF2652 domain-containing protein [Flavobacterium columnare]
MTNTKVREGVILIPDFSGFTEFVFNTKIYMGENIIKQLLQSLIDMNNRYFYISEIEGDAILFYKYNKKPSFKDIVEVVLRMNAAFEQKLLELNLLLNTQIKLSLKFIIHHGKFSRYNIKLFRKLYGKPVVEAHKLLKNEYAEQPSYILFSNSFLEVAKNNNYVISDKAVSIDGIGKIYYLKSKLQKFNNEKMKI